MNRPSDENELLGLIEDLLRDEITPERLARLERRLDEDPEARRLYFDYVDLHLGLESLHGEAEEAETLERIGHDLGSSDPAGAPAGRGRRPRRRIPGWPGYALAAVLLLGLAVALVMNWATDRSGGSADRSVATLAQSAGAEFYGNAPAMGSPVETGRKYALASGLVELAFDNGARAVVEAPAVFTVTAADRMAMSFGKCSVTAEGPAEGFTVDTPTTSVVDRGTRFGVDVDESGDADVQVYDGRAEIRGGADGSPLAQLTTGMARRFRIGREQTTAGISFRADRFVRRLPDRVARYSVSTHPKGGAHELESVTVQRGGRVETYATGELVGVRLVHFKTNKSRVNMTTSLGSEDPYGSQGSGTDRAGLLHSDRSVNTGLINPGSSERPLTDDPVMNDPENPDRPNTPGMAIRFERPVVNGPGPDAVFFDLQVVVHPEDGDPFHVSPLRFERGLRSHTVSRYDIRKSSPEAKTLAGFRLYKFDRRVGTLGELERASHNGGRKHTIPCKLLAVGIDLSDLGYPRGAAVEGLFIQDAGDDGNYVDPVFIAGLPGPEYSDR